MTMILGAVATTSSHRRLEWVQSGENMATEPAPERRSQRVRLAATEAVAWEGAAADLDVRRRAALGFDEALALLLEYERTGRDEALLTGEDGRAVRGPERQRRQTGLAAQAKAFSVVQSHLRHDPRLVARVMEHVHAAPERTTVILDALSSASTPGAQAALRSLMLDPSLPDAQRRSIASRLIRTPSPNATTVDVFIQKLYDPILGRYAIYGLGTMARKLRKRGSSARARQLHDRLAEGLAQAREPAAQIDFLRGLANSADPGNVELVSPWLKHAHKGIRGAAFQALRLISGPKVEQLLRHSLRAESTNTVRRTMLASLLRREPSDVLVDVIRDIALNSEDLASRYRSVKVLQRWSVAMPELRRDLAEIAKTDEHDRVRALAAMSPATAQRADTIG